MHLIWFHRVLIGAAVAFCLGYAAWEFRAFLRGGGIAPLLISLAFAAGAVILAVYLKRLKRFLNLPD